ncbi:myelocytomatosis oncogene homolog [Stigmatopora argus]
MLQSFGGQSCNWVCTEPPLFDDEFFQSLMIDLQSLPTPPQSPPAKEGAGKPLSKGDQLSYVSDMLLEDGDMRLDWNCAFIHEGGGGGGRPRGPPDEEDEGLWRCLVSEDKLTAAASVLGSSPLLSDMDTGIFEGLAGSTLDCQNLMENRETGEATSDYSSTGGDVSTYSSSDSDEEIDVVTVARCPPSPARRRRRQRPSDVPDDPDEDDDDDDEEEEEARRALRRHRFEIQLQHNYAAPRPASPPPSSSNRRPAPSARHQSSSRQPAETEDEEERRRTHNVMERQRRNELKNCFLRLRDNIPELSRNDKASKVVILKKARDCIHGLEGHARRLTARREKLRAKQEELKARLQRAKRC